MFLAKLLTAATASDDEMLWAAMAQLAADFPDADPDGDVWTWATRNRSAIESGAEQTIAAGDRQRRERESRGREMRLVNASHHVIGVLSVSNTTNEPVLDRQLGRLVHMQAAAVSARIVVDLLGWRSDR